MLAVNQRAVVTTLQTKDPTAMSPTVARELLLVACVWDGENYCFVSMASVRRTTCIFFSDRYCRAEETVSS